MRTSRLPFAEVAVAPPYRREQPGPVRGIAPHVATFHYAVPAELDDVAIAGALVLVPFGRSERKGVIMRRAARASVEQTRVLGSVLPATPLPEDLVHLAAWLSAYTITPLYECVSAMLAPGATAGEIEVYRRTKAPILVAELDTEALHILGVFAGGRTMTAAEVGREAKVHWPEVRLGALVAAGLLQTAQEKVGTEVRVRRRRFAALDVSDAGEWRRTLADTRRRKKADAVAALASAADGSMDATELRRVSGITKAQLSDMIEAGFVSLDGESVSLVVRGARAANLEDDLRGTRAHMRVQAYLAAAGEPVADLELRRELGVTRTVIDDLLGLGLIRLDERVVWRDPLQGRPLDRRPAPELTPEQEAAWRVIREALLVSLGAEEAVARNSFPLAEVPRLPASGSQDDPPVVLVQGVTGSGKTELYLRAIAEALSAGGSAIVLVPEIALEPQTVQRVAGRFGDRVGIWHSHLSAGERRDTWERARTGALSVIVGSRSAVFAPLPNLRLIVVDEEHSDSYKQDMAPRYHARDVALVRARLAGATVLLASATPAVETAWHARRGRFRKAELTRRVAPRDPSNPPPPDAPGRSYLPLPEVQVVDMRVELRTGNKTIFSRALHRAIDATLMDGRQVILFLNRRGTSTFVMCRGCGYVVECPHCALPLTYHRDLMFLTCHHCGHMASRPMMCPVCGSSAIRYFGIGTEKVQEVTEATFPGARVLRWDADTTVRRGSHEAILAAFAGGEADILIGTQMIAKGLDLPEVTLVGVVSADTALGLPDFRSAERTFQLLTQVSGRAGRAAFGGRAIVQTYRPDDESIRAAADHDYEAFLERELAFRGEHLYPPYSHLVRLEVQNKSEASARKAAEKLSGELAARIKALGLPDTEVIGPAPCFFRRLRDRYRWQVVVRSTAPHALLGGWVTGPGWRIDVDPTGLL